MFSKIFSSSDSMSLMSHLSSSCCWSQPWNIHPRCNTTAEWLGSYKLRPRSWYTCHCQGCRCWMLCWIWPCWNLTQETSSHYGTWTCEHWWKKTIQTYPTVDTNMKIPTINQLKTQHNWAMFFCFSMLVQVATILSSHIPSDKLFPRFPQR